ncbi:ATP-dependent RNA helicase DDX24 [Protopterus annectens]|uniref:ATP-dependent RNA helicase DDX24 n=1 Tax=Protopterus annectens TaxID=7888 RepID=UPI001CFAE7BC|nr:ATP-dependent RNA helicase DDX24 [Protopterus annectens]
MKVKKERKTFVRPFKRFKRKQGIRVLGEWKPVEIDTELFDGQELEGMTCFEELTAYTLSTSSNDLKEKGKKRKISIAETDDSILRKKKKKKLKLHKDNSYEAVGSLKGGEKRASEQSEDRVYPEEQCKIKTFGITTDTVAETETSAIPVKITSRKKEKRKKKKIVTSSSVEQGAQLSKAPQKVRNWTASALCSQSSMPSSQPADVSAWKDLFVPETVLKALRSLGFSDPTPIQALTLPSAVRDKMDILGAAETGSGKTLAFAIPMIHLILEWRKSQDAGTNVHGSPEDPLRIDSKSLNTKKKASQEEDEDDSDDGSDTASLNDMEGDSSATMGCVKVTDDIQFDFETNKLVKKVQKVDQHRPLLGLVLTPTRELAVQVKHHIDAVCTFTGIRTAIVVGGMAPQKQERVLNRRPEIVIATPGRLWELIKGGHPHLSYLKKLRCLVIDEADRMVEKGHFAELSELLEMLNDSKCNPNRQNFVFSATLTMVHQLPKRILKKKNTKSIDRETKLQLLMKKIGIQGKPKVIDLTRKEATVETLTETRIHCDTEEKDYYLYYFLLQYPGRTMVFANSIDCIKRLNSLLTILECSPLPLHANMHQKQRLKNLERFAERDSSVLLTTDVAARGLDIPNVQHVIHYQVPRTSETYVHRSGRTARAFHEGLSLLLIGPNDMMNFKKIYKTLGKNEDLPLFPVETKCMAAIKERVDLARSIEKMEYHNSKAKQHNSWVQQAAEALELDVDEDLLIGGKQDEQEKSEKQKILKSLKKQLKRALSQPVFKNIMKTRYPTQLGKLTLPHLPVANSESALNSVSKIKNQKRKKNATKT